MNRRDFLKAGAAASVVGALPVNAKPINTPGVPKTWDSDRIERYQAYRSIINDNFELNDKIQKIAGESAKRIDEFPSDGMLTINDILNSNDKFGDVSFVGVRSSHRYLRNLYRAYNLAVYGDGFYELIYNTDYPPDALYGRRPICVQELPADTVYRIETIKGKVVEYQQSKTGPDYAALSQQPLEGTDPRLMLINKSTAIRFRPDQIYHLRIGSPIFQPYGTSLLEVVRKNPEARIGEGAIENFMVVFEKGMQDLKDLCK
jgi:hypothetical protein